MITKPFEYVAPGTLLEACEFLNKHDDAKVLAGGQSLLPILKLNMAEIPYLVDLKRIPNMSYIRIGRESGGGNKDRDTLIVGALTTHAEIAQSELVKSAVPLLAETAKGIGHPLVRNRGTIGGSLAHCDPAADFCVSALALDASMTLAKFDGSKRVLPAHDFFQGTFATALEKGEILESISFSIPPPQNNTGHAFEKLTLGHGDFPLIVASVLVSMDGAKQGDRTCTDVAIALGGVSDRAVRIDQAEQVLRGKKEKDIGFEELDRAASIASDESKPEADLEVSAEYKKRMVRILVRRALSRAIGMTREKSTGGVAN